MNAYAPPALRAARSPVFASLAALLLCPLLLPSPAKALDARTLYQRVQASVVRIVCETDGGIVEGTGFFVGDGSLVATNHHVVENATVIGLKTPDGDIQVPLTLMRADRKQDLAVLRVLRPGRPLPLAPGLPDIGEEVMTIGNPLGLENSISLGVVSGLRRKGAVRLVQTTAAISQGNSGGPLLNEGGAVLAVNTFYFDGGQNLNFAVAAEHLHAMLGAAAPGPAALPGPGGVNRRTVATPTPRATAPRSATPPSAPTPGAPLPGVQTRTVHNRHTGDLFVLSGQVPAGLLGPGAGLRAELLDASGRVLATRDFLPGGVLTDYQLQSLHPGAIASRLRLSSAPPTGGGVPFMAVFTDPPPDAASARVLAVRR